MPSLAPVVLSAAHKARVALEDAIGKATSWSEAKLENGRFTNGADSIDWEAGCAMLSPGGVTARGEFVKELATSSVHGAQAAKVEVDTFTGETRVIEMVAIQDVGMPLNRLATRSQINNGMIQAMSFGL